MLHWNKFFILLLESNFICSIQLRPLRTSRNILGRGRVCLLLKSTRYSATIRHWAYYEESTSLPESRGLRMRRSIWVVPNMSLALGARRRLDPKASRWSLEEARFIDVEATTRCFLTGMSARSPKEFFLPDSQISLDVELSGIVKSAQKKWATLHALKRACSNGLFSCQCWRSPRWLMIIRIPLDSRQPWQLVNASIQNTLQITHPKPRSMVDVRSSNSFSHVVRNIISSLNLCVTVFLRFHGQRSSIRSNWSRMPFRFAPQQTAQCYEDAAFFTTSDLSQDA